MKNKKHSNEPTLNADETRIFIRLVEIVYGPMIYTKVSKKGIANELKLPLQTIKDAWKRFIRLGLLRKSRHGTLCLNTLFTPSTRSK